MGVSENPEEITVETGGYAVDWDLAKNGRWTDMEPDIGHERRSGVAVKCALNRC